MDFLDYTDVAMEYRGAMVEGRLKLTDEKIIFKPQKSGKSEQIQRENIELVNWQRLAGTWGIRIFTDKGDLHRFAGFKDVEREKLAKFFKKTYDLEMLDRELSVKGHNWGTANFSGGLMTFEIGKADGFEVPLSYVNQCISGKNEATLEFHLNEDTPVNLSEMRFFIPGSELAGDDPVETFRDQVMKNASAVTTSGDAIAIFREISCLSPRGRYDIKIFPTYIHLHGKTFDYKIPGSSVMRLFLLPHKDQVQMHFAVNLDPPIKQGQTRYHYLIFNFKIEDEEEIELPFTDEEIQEKFDGKLEREISGPTYEVLSKILKAVVSKKITVPGSFVGHNGTPALTCSHKAASGFIYPLERGLIFIYKPPIYLRYDEIRNVVFERSGGSTRSFDISVATTNDIMYTFSSIEKNEYGKLYEYMKSKKVMVKTSGKGDGGTLNWEDEKKVDHYLEGVKADAEDMSDYSMSSDDTDFNPDTLEALSAKEEYDSEPSSSSGDDSEGEEKGPEAEKRREERKKKNTERVVKRSKSASTGGEKKERKTKRTKLPGQPKRPMSAYFLWMNANREQIKSDHPGLSIGEFGKKSGELWKTMKDTDKEEWVEKNAADKIRYVAELEKWKSEGGLEAMKAAKKQAKAAKRAEAGGATTKTKSKSGPKAASKAAIATTSSAGSGSNFKSKEFIEDDSDSSVKSGGNDSDDDDDKKKGKKSPPAKAKGKGKKKASSDEEMKSETASESAAAATSNSD
jgi:structure-specific recognition protein 1